MMPAARSISRAPSVRAGLLLAAVLLALPGAGAGQSPETAKVARATATLNGVFSPRGFFNVTVGLYRLRGVEAAKFDLKKSRITIDFKPGVTVTATDIQQVMADAGYRPGPVEIDLLSPDEAVETGPGWVKIKHPSARNAFVRWLQLNF